MSNGVQAWIKGWRGAVVAAALALSTLAPATAAEQCAAADERGIQRCRAGLTALQIERIRTTQQKSQWCWAASIEMIMAHHGIRVSQAELAQAQFGAEVDQGITGAAMTALLERGDIASRTFLMVAGVADRDARRFDLGRASVVEELAGERPLLVGVRRPGAGHAMVLVEVEYERFTREDAVRITGGTVIDPDPGQGLRALRRDEMRPSYLAAVQPAGARQFAALAPVQRP